MKRRLLYPLLAAEAAVCVLVCAARASLPGLFSAALAFPYEQLGLGLRALSLAGRVGNAAALTLYAALCLLPLWVLARAARRRPLRGEDALLVLLSAVLFAALYGMVNPAALGRFLAPVLAAGDASFAMAFLGGLVDSVLCGYLVLRVLRAAVSAGLDRLRVCLEGLLWLLAALLVWAVFGLCFSRLLSSFVSLEAGNTGAADLAASYTVLSLKFLVDALPYALDLGAVVLGSDLLAALGREGASPLVLAAAERLTRWCAGSLAAAVLANVGFNLLQLLCARSLHTVSETLTFPAFSLVLVLCALLASRLLAEHLALKRDNALFI